MMKAIIQTGFGPPDSVLTLGEVGMPSVDDGEVLVHVRAASIHIGDVYGIRGLPKVMRPLFKSMKPKSGIVGTDLAGVVEAVGKDVTHLAKGDEVFGSCKGAFAEYASANADSVALKPSNLTMEEVSAVGVSAFTALQGLRDHGHLSEGQKVLIVGASGGVGTFAVQIAKSFGAEVTGVCSTRNLDMVRAIGADHVIDYTQQNFTERDPEYDLILDNVGSHSLKDTRRVLTAAGVLLANGSAAPTGWFGGLGRPAKAAVNSVLSKQQGRPFVSTENREDLLTLAELAAEGKIVPVIDRVFSLEQAIEAIGHVGVGSNQGTTIISVEPSEVHRPS